MPVVIVKTRFELGWNIGDRVEIHEGERLDALLEKGDVELVDVPAAVEEVDEPAATGMAVVEEPIPAPDETKPAPAKKRGRPKKAV